MIRLAVADDLASIVEIRNHYVANTTVTFDETPETTDDRRRWFEQFGPAGRYRLVVAADEQVCGWACSVGYRDHPAFLETVEFNICLAPTHLRQGLGTLLYRRLLAELEQRGHSPRRRRDRGAERGVRATPSPHGLHRRRCVRRVRQERGSLPQLAVDATSDVTAWADVELGGRHRGFRTVGRPDPDVDRRPPRTARPGGDHRVRWRSSTSMYASSSAITASVRRWPVNTSKASIAWPRNRSSPLIRCRPASAPRRKSVVSTGE